MMQKMQFCSRVVLATVLVTFAASLCAMPSAPQCSDCQPFPPGTRDSAPGCWLYFGVYLFRQHLWLWV